MMDRERGADDDVALSALLDDALPVEDAAVRRRLAESRPLPRHRGAAAVDAAVRETYSASPTSLASQVTTGSCSARRGFPVRSPRRPEGRWYARPTFVTGRPRARRCFVLASVVLHGARHAGPLASSRKMARSTKVRHAPRGRRTE